MCTQDMENVKDDGPVLAMWEILSRPRNGDGTQEERKELREGQFFSIFFFLFFFKIKIKCLWDPHSKKGYLVGFDNKGLAPCALRPDQTGTDDRSNSLLVRCRSLSGGLDSLYLQPYFVSHIISLYPMYVCLYLSLYQLASEATASY